MENNLALSAAIEEYKALRADVDEANKQQFQLGVAVDAISIAAFLAVRNVFDGANGVSWLGFLMVGVVALVQFIFLLQLTHRIAAISKRLQAVEGIIRTLSGCDEIMQWETQYVRVVFPRWARVLNGSPLIVPLMVYAVSLYEATARAAAIWKWPIFVIGFILLAIGIVGWEWQRRQLERMDLGEPSGESGG